MTVQSRPLADALSGAPDLRLLVGTLTSLLTGFEPGTGTLGSGFQAAPQFRPLPVDVVLQATAAAWFDRRARPLANLHVPIGHGAGGG